MKLIIGILALTVLNSHARTYTSTYQPMPTTVYSAGNTTYYGNGGKITDNGYNSYTITQPSRPIQQNIYVPKSNAYDSYED